MNQIVQPIIVDEYESPKEVSSEDIVFCGKYLSLENIDVDTEANLQGDKAVKIFIDDRPYYLLLVEA